jgi:asparagine synthase (glutamine-hydrolysing)
MELNNTPVLSKISLCEISTYMQNVLLRDSDQMSMAHALEIRVPFLDHRLVEYVLKVSDTIKYPAEPKKLLLDSFKGYLPDELIYRKKMGFVFPWEKWLKNELKTEMDKHINDLENRGIFNPGTVSELWNKFQNNHPLITWTRVWPLIVLENWIKNNRIEA